MRIIELEQGSAEWHAWRVEHAMASESPCVMSCAQWDPQTWLQLWELKQGFRVIDESGPMRYGREREAQARTHFNNTHGTQLKPVCVEDGLFGASLDGIEANPDGVEFVAEVKCPWRGPDAAVYEAAKSATDICTREHVGRWIPEHYWYQVQHQLMVTGLPLCAFYVWTPTGAITLWVEADTQSHDELRRRWADFWWHMSEGVPPEPQDKDIIQREDVAFIEAVRDWLAQANQQRVATRHAEEARERLIELAGETSCQAEGVRVTRYFRQGSVNWTDFLKDHDINPEPYRKAGRIVYSIREVNSDG